MRLPPIGRNMGARVGSQKAFGREADNRDSQTARQPQFKRNTNEEYEDKAEYRRSRLNMRLQQARLEERKHEKISREPEKEPRNDSIGATHHVEQMQ